jgi:cbb3-type cytochrome oxidase maturation protein
MTIALIAELGFALVFGVMAIWALAWAIRSGQFADFRQSAASIFDEDEPVGEMTDRFPEPAPRRGQGAGPWRP